MAQKASNDSLIWGDSFEGGQVVTEGIVHDRASRTNGNGLSSVFLREQERVTLIEDRRDSTSRTEDERMSKPKKELVGTIVRLQQRLKMQPRVNHRTLCTPKQPRPSFESSSGSEYDPISQGGFGEVGRAIGSFDRKRVAMKRIKINANSVSDFNAQVRRPRRECQIHAELPIHENLVGHHASGLVYNPSADDPKEESREHYKWRAIVWISMELCESTLRSYLSPDCHEGDRQSRMNVW